MGRPSDTELWRRAARGEAWAFGELFERHARAVYNHLFRRTADWAVAEDLTSVVFLEAWRGRGRVSLEHESALPWFLGVATNVLRNRRRSECRHRAALDRLPRETVAPFDADSDERMDDEARMRAILVHVDALSHDQRDVLALCVWAELSYEEASAALGVAMGTVRSRLSRAKARLRELARADGHELDGDHAVQLEEAERCGI